jgi:hypothetical protein
MVFLTRHVWVWGETSTCDTKWVTRWENFSFVGMGLRRVNPMGLYPLPSPNRDEVSHVFMYGVV